MKSGIWMSWAIVITIANHLTIPILRTKIHAPLEAPLQGMRPVKKAIHPNPVLQGGGASAFQSLAREAEVAVVDLEGREALEDRVLTPTIVVRRKKKRQWLIGL